MIIIRNNELPKQMMADFLPSIGVHRDGDFQRHFRCNELDGYAAVDESGEIIGCITYVIDGKIVKLFH